MKEEASQRSRLLIIQCDSGHLNGDLIACARYRIYDMRAKALLNRSRYTNIPHVVFIVHLPVQAASSTFVGFQGDPWISCHIDELKPSGKNGITLETAQGVTVSQLFYGGPKLVKLERQTSELSNNMAFERLPDMYQRFEEGMEEYEGEGGEFGHHRGEGTEKEVEVQDIEGEVHSRAIEKYSPEGVEEPEDSRRNGRISQKGSAHFPSTYHEMLSEKVASLTTPSSDVYTQCVRLNNCIQAAASRVQDSRVNKRKAAERVQILIQIIPQKPTFPLGKFVYS